MKKKLLLVRHATAEDQTMMIRDFQRELVGKGRTDAFAMGKWLASRDFSPQMLITSPAPRAYQTAVIMADQLKFDTHEIIQKELLYDGGPRAYLSTVNAVPETISTVLLFGHNPDITYFAEYLSGADIGSMSKCGIVVLEFDDQLWAEISSKSGKFVSYTTPRTGSGTIRWKDRTETAAFSLLYLSLSSHFLPTYHTICQAALLLPGTSRSS